MALIVAFWKDRRGATAIEYAMIGSLISILCLVGATSIGNSLSTKFLGPLLGGFN